MKKHITYAIAIAILAGVWSTGCDEDESDTTNSNVRTTSFDGAEGGCTNGGIKIEVLVDGVVDETQTQYICNGNSEQQNTCDPSCKENKTCQNGVCVDNSEQPKNCSTPGYVMCNNACIDPMTSNQYCGANEQCKGYGQAALAWIIRYFKDRGAHVLYLSTEPENELGLHVYHKFGFRETGEFEEDEAILKLEL